MMELTEEHKKQIEEIKSKMFCPFNFKCEKEGFTSYPKVKKITTLLECFEEDATRCGCSLSFGETHFCKCPLNKYIHGLCLGLISPESLT
jgi:hypothetical protein